MSHVSEPDWESYGSYAGLWGGIWGWDLRPPFFPRPGSLARVAGKLSSGVKTSNGGLNRKKSKHFNIYSPRTPD